MLGYGLTPYSVLVPFLVFAIGTSHGAQKMNGVMQDIGRGTHPLVAARYTFRRLFLAGFAALICDVDQLCGADDDPDSGDPATCDHRQHRCRLLVITNLMMLPTMLSYTGVSKTAASRSLEQRLARGAAPKHPLWNFLDLFTTPQLCHRRVAFMVVMGGFGWAVGRHVQVGDLECRRAGTAARIRNITGTMPLSCNHFTTGNDTFIVMADTRHARLHGLRRRDHAWTACNGGCSNCRLCSPPIRSAPSRNARRCC